MTTEEKSVFILEFMKIKPMETGAYYLPQFGYMNANGLWKDSFLPSQLKFHTEWKWLLTTLQSIIIPRNIKITIDAHDSKLEIFNKMYEMVRTLNSLGE